MPFSRVQWCVLALASGILLSPGSGVLGAIIYVDAGATGTNDGSSWEDAFADLQDGLAVAEWGDQAWVAGGIYRPAPPGGSREATFQLLSGFGLYGGFAGWETSLDERNVEANETVLSGDLNGDDGPDFENNADNSFRVLLGSDVDETAVLDGFTVTAGHADVYGGGIYIDDGSPLLVQCTFRENVADVGGGAMYNREGSPAIVRCTFIGNRGMYFGGALLNLGVFSNPIIINSSFLGNEAVEFGLGGAIYNASGLDMINCLLSGNSGYWGGAIYNDGYAVLTNCTLAFNTAEYIVGGIGGHKLVGATLTNCILWGNSHQNGMDECAQACGETVNYCCIQGWSGNYGGVGNFGDDPLFVDPDGADDIFGTLDDDYRLSPGSPCADAADNDAVPADSFDLDGNGNTDEPIPVDLDDRPRFVDEPETQDTGNGVAPIVDMGAYELLTDCNGNGVPDFLDITAGTSQDCTENGIPDECEPDCNGNAVADSCDISQGTSQDCAGNGIPDECEPDCNDNAVADSCDIAEGTSQDCNANGIPDECDAVDSDCNGNQVPDECEDCNGNGVADSCDLAQGSSQDCNANDTPDECDIAQGTSPDCNANGIPDECIELKEDCNGNGVPDSCDIAEGTSEDCNENIVPDACDIAEGTSEDCTANGIPDECEPDCNENDVADSCDIAAGTSEDCNANAIPDECDIARGTSEDCNGNGVVDSCDIAEGTSQDINGNGVPDECESDCNGNGIPDDLDIGDGTSEDCNENEVPDECDFANGTSEDCNGNVIPDECDIAEGTSQDCTANGIPDQCDIVAGTSEDCNENAIPDECDLLFIEQVITTAANNAVSVFAADLDGDGDTDVLSASIDDNKIAWYENTDGLGSFGPQQIITTAATWPISVFSADLDGDGDNDVLSASYFDGKIAWYRNTDGLGSFGPQQIITIAADYAYSVFVADLDGDGDPDVLSASAFHDKIAWYENTDGLGSFGPQQIITTEADWALSVFAADLDGDGDHDVLSASNFDDKIAWYENIDGLGSFGPQQIITTEANEAWSVFAADLDGDGDTDILSASRGDHKIAWYENTDGLGSFGPQQIITTEANDARSVFAADLDGDGNTDVLSASNYDDKIAWYRNTDGLGTFGPQQIITTAANGAFSVFAADLDGDGDNDVLSASSVDDQIAWYETPSDCNGNAIPDVCDIAAGTSEDCNGNGKPDECELDVRCPCEGDVNRDGTVDPLDSGFVLSRFGCPVGEGHPGCDAADQNGDGMVDPLDVGFILARFGDCEE